MVEHVYGLGVLLFKRVYCIELCNREGAIQLCNCAYYLPLSSEIYSGNGLSFPYTRLTLIISFLTKA